MTTSVQSARGLSESEKGVALAVLAHVIWGGTAIYFGLLRHISPVEIAINRGLWSLPVAAVIVWYLGQFGDVAKAMKQPRHLAVLALTGFIILFNWGFFIWSIEQGRALEASLGYFINPLMNVGMGYLFLGERFSRPQLVAILLAAVAVIVQTVAAGVFPWLGLLLASTFCLYGFLRKTVPVGPTQGFLIEVAVIALPLAIADSFFFATGAARFGRDVSDTLMLAGCGLLTSVPLILYTASVKRIRYSTAGLLQYLSPSLVFLTAIFIFREPIPVWKLVTFVIVWVALAIFTVATIHDDRSRRRAASGTKPV